MIFLSFSLGASPHYFIAIKKKEGKFLENMEHFIPLLPPPGNFYADPFLFTYQGKQFLFFENFEGKKGVISYVTLEPDGTPSEPQLALSLKTHLSFPYVFEEEEEIYMVPETYHAGRVSLYKCLSFPNVWKQERVLLHGDYFSDPLLFKLGDYYWLFVATHLDQLSIYYAKDLKSRFVRHPISNRRIHGRNAGPLFWAEGKLIRPTMECEVKYGRAVVFKEIIQLTPTQFVEKEVARLEPTWAPHLIGTHTYGENNTFIVYDGETSEEEAEGDESAPLL